MQKKKGLFRSIFHRVLFEKVSHFSLCMLSRFRQRLQLNTVEIVDCTFYQNCFGLGQCQNFCIVNFLIENWQINKCEYFMLRLWISNWNFHLLVAQWYFCFVIFSTGTIFHVSGELDIYRQNCSNLLKKSFIYRFIDGILLFRFSKYFPCKLYSDLKKNLNVNLHFKKVFDGSSTRKSIERFFIYDISKLFTTYESIRVNCSAKSAQW